MPVPGSFADLFTEPETRDYCGDFWYETTFYAPECGDARELYLRFGSISHRATVYVNGREVGSNEGGFLPVVCRITDAVRQGAENRLTVRANNELSEATLPCGAVATLSDGRKIAKPYFDFFHYAGIQRSVYLLSLPKEQILDFDILHMSFAATMPRYIIPCGRTAAAPCLSSSQTLTDTQWRKGRAARVR